MVVSSQRQSFDTLNGMRGIAALAVFTMHIQWFLAGLHPAIVSVAVDFFFVLSGFVIAYAYTDDLRAGMRRRDFMVARFIRLYPMFLAGLLLGMAAVWLYERPADLSPFWGNAGFNSFMLPYPLRYPREIDDLYPLNFPAWSLFFELIAYSIFALTLRRLTNRWLGVLILAGLVALIVTGMTEGTLDRGVWRPSWPGGLARVTFSFFAGVALYRLWLIRPTRIRLHPALLFLLLALPLLWRPAEGPYAWLYELAIIALWMPAMVWLGTGSSAAGVWQRICAALGAISYPVYIVHAPLIFIASHYGNWQGAAFLTENAPYAAIAFIVLVTVSCWAMATYVDLPVRRWLSRKFLPARPGRHPTQIKQASAGDPVSVP